MWAHCRGVLCKQEWKRRPGDPPAFPVDRPSPAVLPVGWRLEDRIPDGCPSEVIQPEEWAAVRLHGRWRQTGRGLPGPGSMMEQDAWLLDALAIVEAETTLIEVARAERARASAKR